MYVVLVPPFHPTKPISGAGAPLVYPGPPITRAYQHRLFFSFLSSIPKLGGHRIYQDPQCYGSQVIYQTHRSQQILYSDILTKAQTHRSLSSVTLCDHESDDCPCLVAVKAKGKVQGYNSMPAVVELTPLQAALTSIPTPVAFFPLSGRLTVPLHPAGNAPILS